MLKCKDWIQHISISKKYEKTNKETMNATSSEMCNKREQNKRDSSTDIGEEPGFESRADKFKLDPPAALFSSSPKTGGFTTVWQGSTAKTDSDRCI